jgi:tRNA(Ile)-lysidine synthase
MLLDKKYQNILHTKNLLAFSGGVDSSAMFFYLVENKIEFDLAIVNYNLRTQSKEEVKYAKELAKKYNKNIYIKEIDPEYSKNEKSFEKKARDIRYNFFEEIINKEKYTNLITAHHLNDRLEWTLMQMTKGAGLKEMYGMKDIDKRKGYSLVRPFFNIDRNEIEEFLKIGNHKFFIDHTNEEEKYTRNHFRKNYVNKLMKEYSAGIKKTFEYLSEDLKELKSIEPELIKGKLYIIKNKDISESIIIRSIDSLLKKEFNLVLSANQKKEIIKTKFDTVLSHKIAIGKNEESIFISPMEIVEKMDDKFKEKMRKNKIPNKIRGYIYNLENIKIDLQNLEIQ